MPRATAVPPDQFTSFGQLLKHLRRRAGLTQRELSIAVGYSDTQISRLEKDQRIPDAAALTARFVPALHLAHEPAWTARLLELAETARATAAPAAPATAPAARPLVRHNLPIQLTSFIGRIREVGDVQRLLHLNRLLTLTGAGGSGKTRLALEAGQALLGLDQFPDGVWFVELAPASDGALVPRAILDTLGLREEAGSPSLPALTDYLQSRSALLILDNCEHVVQACASTAETLLRACPRLRLLAASREALGVPGEMTFAVPPLSLPEPPGDSPPEPEALLEYEAVRLFVERAQVALPGFRLTSANAAALVRVCRRLDGIPLAIELAAARVKTLQVEQIAGRLEDRFRLLTGGSRNALPRHQALRACIDWSHALLPSPEQMLWRRLSVFAGGLSLEAAEAVCGADGLESAEVLDGLTQLANKSILIVEREEGQETRYRLLETMRQYAQEKLLEANEAQAVRDRHLGYFLQLSQQAESALTGPSQVAWADRLQGELDNLRTALDWSLEWNVEAGLRLASALLKFWEARGYNDEGAHWLGRLLDRPAAQARTALRGKALSDQAYLITTMSDFSRARLLAEESLALCRDIGDEHGIAYSLLVLGHTHHFQGDNNLAGWSSYAQSLAHYRALGDKLGISEVLGVMASFDVYRNTQRARAHAEESLALCRELGHLAGIGDRLSNLGMLALYDGNFDSARVHLEESLAIHHRLGVRGALFRLYSLGDLAYAQGDYARARDYYEECLALSQETGLHTVGQWANIQLGNVALRLGQAPRARAYLHDGWTLLERAGIQNASYLCWTLEAWASLALAEGQLERAARLLAWIGAMRTERNEAPSPIIQADLDRAWSLLRTQLDPETIAAASAAGRAMTLDQAVGEALAEGRG